MAKAKKNPKARKNSYRMRFTLPDGSRVEYTSHTIAEHDQVNGHVPKLISAKRVGASCLESEEWAAKLPKGILRDSLVRWGLIDNPADREKTLGDLRELVMNDTSVCSNTLINRQNWIDCLISFRHEGFLLRDFTKEMALEYGRWVAQNYKAGYSANGVFKAARRFFKQAVIVGWIERNPFDNLPLPTIGEKRKGTVTQITESDMQKLFDGYYNKEKLAIICLMRYGGLRGGSELENLRWDLDSIRWSTADSPCTITVFSPKQKNHEHRKTRIVPLQPTAEKALLDWLQASKAEEQPDFPHCRMFPKVHEVMEKKRQQAKEQIDKGKRRTAKIEFNLNSQIRKIFNSVGVYLGRAYDLRYNCVSDLLTPNENGSVIDPAVYEQIANHDFQTGMSIYQCLFPDRLEKGIAQVAKHWEQKAPPILPPPAPFFAPGSNSQYPAECNKKNGLSLENREYCEITKKPCEIPQGVKLPQVGFEPITLGSEDRCAIQLRH